jgi:hypothetical protein
MNQIILRDFNLGGISDSIFQGRPNSVATMVGFDIHSEPGILKVNQSLSKESGSNIDQLVKAIVPCSDGNTYLFGSSTGKIWKRTSAGAYSLSATAAPAAGTAGIMDAVEYQGYIYYTMQSRVGRVAIGSPTNWAGRDDSWATFTKTDADFHPIFILGKVLYIGDASYLAQVDAGVFSAMALDIDTPYRIKSLGSSGTDLLIGTYINAYTNSILFKWNTWSETVSSVDEVPEMGINSFLKTDNFNLVSAGTRGNIYYVNDTVLENYKRLPGNWILNRVMTIHQHATENVNGLPLIGISNIATGGSPIGGGVYSLGSYDRNYPKVLNLEYIISTGNSRGVEIGCIKNIGDTILVSWRDDITVTYGVDKISTTLKHVDPYLTTRIINNDRTKKKVLSGYISYRSYPTGTTIVVYYKNNYATDWQQVDTVKDTDRNLVILKEAFPEANTIEVKVKCIIDGNNAPELEEITLFYE